MKFITTIFSVLFSLSIQAQLVTYPGTLSTGMPHNDDHMPQLTARRLLKMLIIL